MDNSIFRKKSIERVSSPEQLNDYIRVANPGVWVVIIAVIVLLIGVCVWGSLGRLETVYDTVAVAQNGELTVYIKEDKLASVSEGQTLNVGKEEYILSALSGTPVAAEGEDFTDYVMHLGQLQSGEWVYTSKQPTELSDGVYKAQIITDSVSPMSFVFN